MVLHEYAGEELGSRAVLRVLRTLHKYRGKVFTIREVARTSGISHPEASVVLRNLERRGIVKLQPVGKASQVSLNEESYILKSIVEPMSKAEQNTLRALLSSIKPFFTDRRIISAAIFGSAARELEKTTNNIDLIVITEDVDFASECVSKANMICVTKFGYALSPLIVDRARFIREMNTDPEKSILGSYLMVNGIDLSGSAQNAKDR
ncbi:MAG: MarR family transcriptional regulator [Nitrososphaerota archaeon]|nr:MarR family transcriptional regulator [Nitrososphaerota archaeon]MDG6923613.1 MarR family transcriptional regulator [Nitrososphaerota archaeon]